MAKSDLPLSRCLEILENGEVGYLALSSQGRPYCLPFNFVWVPDPGRIYLHTGLKGQKWTILKENDRVCFTVAEVGRKRTGESPCQYSYDFESVMAVGTAAEVAEASEAADALARFIEKYREGPVTAVPPEKMSKLKMIRMDITRMTGRQNR